MCYHKQLKISLTCGTMALELNSDLHHPKTYEDASINSEPVLDMMT